MHNTHIHTDHPQVSPAWTMYILYSNSQGTITSAETGSLVPTEFTANALKVTLSPLVKFTLSWLTSNETCNPSELRNVWFVPLTSTCNEGEVLAIHSPVHKPYKASTKLTVYSSTGCPPLSLSVTVTCTSLSDTTSVTTLPMTGAMGLGRYSSAYQTTS